MEGFKYLPSAAKLAKMLVVVVPMLGRLEADEAGCTQRGESWREYWRGADEDGDDRSDEHAEVARQPWNVRDVGVDGLANDVSHFAAHHWVQNLHERDQAAAQEGQREGQQHEAEADVVEA